MYPQKTATFSKTGKKGRDIRQEKSPGGRTKITLASAEVPVPEDISEEEEELEDYSSPKDKEAILRDMKSIKQDCLSALF